MKSFIKLKLREAMNVNSLGVAVTRPNQILILMRGIPGSGKSTKAKTLVGEGIIHSTDNVIESLGDYRAFFNTMVESKNFTPLSKAHNTNFYNAKKSMVDGISPIIIDNTNLKANEPKKYVVEALMLGFADANIKIVDVGNGGLDAKSLAERNTHGVPLDKIESMMKSHKSVGELTLKKILESKDMFDASKSSISFSAIVLDEKSRSKLLSEIGDKIPSGWTVIANHMTITLGELKDKTDLGKEITLNVNGLGLSDMAFAARVVGYQSKNEIPHITVAINPNGGKPVMSNNIGHWWSISAFPLTGIVTEVKHNNL